MRGPGGGSGRCLGQSERYRAFRKSVENITENSLWDLERTAPPGGEPRKAAASGSLLETLPWCDRVQLSGGETPSYKHKAALGSVTLPR